LCHYLHFIEEKVFKSSTLRLVPGIGYQYLFNEIHLTPIIYSEVTSLFFIELYFRLRVVIGILFWFYNDMTFFLHTNHHILL